MVLDRIGGHTTVSVNDGIAEGLKVALFPRAESDGKSDFTGV
jgi:hypothetical protein